MIKNKNEEIIKENIIKNIIQQSNKIIDDSDNDNEIIDDSDNENDFYYISIIIKF